MTAGRVALLVGVALLVLVTNVAASILYMVVHGHIIDPGHDPHYYNDHIQVAGPYCSIVVGIPLMFLAGWWVSFATKLAAEHGGATLRIARSAELGAAAASGGV